MITLQKEEVVKILDYYMKNCNRINIDFKYEIDNDNIKLNLESTEDALFTVNGNITKIGVNYIISWVDSFENHDHLIREINDKVFKMVEFFIWQRAGNLITNN